MGAIYVYTGWYLSVVHWWICLVYKVGGRVR